MPSNPNAIMKRIDCLPSHQRELCVRFRDWLVEENDNSERNWINYFKIISMFSEHIGNKRFQDVTKEDVLSFLDKRKKSIEEDPDQKWIVTWNGYLARLLGFFRWLNNDKEKDREDWITPELFSSIKRKKNKRISSYTPNDVWNIDELLTVVKYCSNIRDKAILTIAWDMAARNHEMVRLRLKDIVFKEKYSL